MSATGGNAIASAYSTRIPFARPDPIAVFAGEKVKVQIHSINPFGWIFVTAYAVAVLNRSRPPFSPMIISNREICMHFAGFGEKVDEVI